MPKISSATPNATNLPNRRAFAAVSKLPEVGIQDAQRENEAREVYCLVKQQMLKVTIPHHYQEGREFEPPEQTARAYKFIFRAQTNH